MQPAAIINPDTLRPSAGYSLAEWIKVVGMLAGIGAIPLLARLPRLGHWYWAAGLGAGLLVIILGLSYLVRYLRQKRAESRSADLNLILVESELRGRGVRVFTRRRRQAAEAPTALTSKLAAVQAMAGAGLISTDEALHRSRRLHAILEPVAGQVMSAQAQIEALQQLHASGLISEPAYRDQLSALENGIPQAQADQLGAIRQASILISLGVFILLPALAGLLLQSVEIENAPQVSAYLGGLALVLWATFEGLAFYPYWQQRHSGGEAILGMARSATQIVAALLIWIMLGLPYGMTWPIWLFGAGAGLAVLGAILGTIMAVQDRRRRRLAASDGTDQGPLAETIGGQFQIFTGKDGQFYFRLKAPSGETLLLSEGYTSLRGCRNGVRSVKENAVLRERYDWRQTVDGRYYFVLKAGNQRLIGRSEFYLTPDGRDRAAAWVRSAAPRAGLEQKLTSEVPKPHADRSGAQEQETDGTAGIGRESELKGKERKGVATGTKFQIFKGKDGQFYFRLRAVNGEPILSSEGYQALAGCRNGIEAVKANAPLDQRFEKRISSRGEPYFVLKAANQQVIGTSELYSSAAARDQGITAVKRVAPGAEIEENLR